MNTLDASIYENLAAKFTNCTANIGVIGLGYVGLPLCLALGDAGYSVVGFDVDENKPAHILNGKSYIKSIASESIAEVLRSGKLDATTDMSRLSEMDAILICVPTPIDSHLSPDLSYVIDSCKVILKHLRKGQLIVLESTTYPGTTKEVVLPILQESGLKVGQDVFLAFSPEREDPGNINFSTSQIPKVVGADDVKSQKLAVTLYNEFVSETVPVSSTSTAEAVKITENVFRAVNIALVNELKVIFDKMDINVWEVIEGAKSKPFGFMPFYPGPGLGGHCIPIDPFYLTWKAKSIGVETHFIELAGQINRSMPLHVVSVLMDALSARSKKSINGSKILLLGLTYKKNIDDTRESPALELMKLIEDRDGKVDYFDPYVEVVAQDPHYPSLIGRKSIVWDTQKISEEYDAVLIATDHDNVDYCAIAENCEIVIDTRNACARAGAKMTNVILA